MLTSTAHGQGQVTAPLAWTGPMRWQPDLPLAPSLGGRCGGPGGGRLPLPAGLILAVTLCSHAHCGQAAVRTTRCTSTKLSTPGSEHRDSARAESRSAGRERLWLLSPAPRWGHGEDYRHSTPAISDTPVGVAAWTCTRHIEYAPPALPRTLSAL